jgi:preprotein translocase subunit YajC
MLVLMGLVFYFLLIRPQQKRMKEHKEMVEGLKRGDEVVTQGGLIGKVAKVADEEVTVELADGVKVRVVRQTIASVRGRPEPKPANDAKSD